MYSQISTAQLAKADIVIKPNLCNIDSTDFSKRHEAIIKGEKAAIVALPKIKALVEKLRQEGRF